MAYSITEACTGCTACARICPVGAIHGERKSLHVVDVKTCIECGACGRVCNFKAVLEPSGHLAQGLKKEEWLKPVWNYALCVECNICVQACPNSVIAHAGANSTVKGAQPNQPVLANAKTCIGCSFCARDCPTEAIVMQVQRTFMREL